MGDAAYFGQRLTIHDLFIIIYLIQLFLFRNLNLRTKWLILIDVFYPI